MALPCVGGIRACRHKCNLASAQWAAKGSGMYTNGPSSMGQYTGADGAMKVLSSPVEALAAQLVSWLSLLLMYRLPVIWHPCNAANLY